MMNHAESWMHWRAARAAEMSAAESWLSVIGLVAIEGDRAGVGSADDNVVGLPDGPPHAGTIVVRGIEAEWHPNGGAPVPLVVDLDGVKSAPTAIEVGRFRLYVVERDGRLSVRIRDLAWATTRPFAGIDCFPFDPAWRIDALWERLPAPMELEVPSVTGDLRRKLITHRAVFALPDGTERSLVPVYGDDSGVLFVFRDGTSGGLSYGGGRFLRIDPPAGTALHLDFNRAYNPPCAFTPFATCPLPPPENWLPFAIAAGEKKYVPGSLGRLSAGNPG